MRTLKLIVEDSRKFDDNCSVTLCENADGSKDKMPMIKGPMIETESVNRNGRVYPKDMMLKSVEQYIQDRMQEGRLRSYGELGHPEGVEINLHRWSHYITNLEWNGNLVVGSAQLVDTEYGRIAETVLRNGLQLGVSSRGLGALDEYQPVMREGKEGKMVTEYELVAIDIVADPSAPKGFVQGIMESKEYIISGGHYTEMSVRRSEQAYDNLQEALKTIPKKDRDEYMLKKLSEFLKNL